MKNQFIKPIGMVKELWHLKSMFLPTVIEDVSMFKILDEKTRYAFVSDEFKQTVEKNNLLGFKFKLVWDSENE